MKYTILLSLLLILSRLLFSDVVINLDKAETYTFKGLYNSLGQKIPIDEYSLRVKGEYTRLFVKTKIKGFLNQLMES